MRMNVRKRRILNVLLFVLLCILTMVSIKWNLSAFQMRFTHGIDGRIQSVVQERLPNGTLSVSVVEGSETYYTLGSVREQMVAAVRSANDQLQQALEESPESHPITTRGIAIYLPPKTAKFEKEVKALYLSIAVVRTYQPANVKTDLLVFTPADNFAFAESIGCSSIPRSSRDEEEKCIVLPHVPLSTRNVSTEILVDYHNYVDSVLVVAEFNRNDQYDFLMRTDSDTFITPGFGDWTLPPGVVIATGKGGYGSNNANAHLKWMTTGPLGLKYTDTGNVGSTWYGRTNVVVAAANLSVEVMRWLDSQEFNNFEKHHSGVQGWPHWHWPVLTMYGGHVAINQIENSEKIPHTEGVMELDYGAANTMVMPLAVKHIHCWHSETFFSKFKFQSGHYKDMDLTEYENMESAAAYAGMIAISSDRMSASELRDIINSKSAMQNKEWARIKIDVE